MRLLIITQKINKEDDLLGFFHGWVEELALKVEKISVICLEEGKHDLPKNTRVYSLGKEKGESKTKYFLNFVKYIWGLRKEYDKVFVHMNKEYVLLGWDSWLVMSKKVYLWHNHKKGGIWVRLAVLFSKKVFYTSPQSFTARFKKSIKMPAGINTDEFGRMNNPACRQGRESRRRDSILSLGRISPVKNIHILIDALKILDEKGIEFKANIYGGAPERDKNYCDKVRNQGKNLEQKEKLFFHKSVPNMKVSEIYNKYEIFVNMTNSGSMDKTILEAMASGCLVLVSNRSFENVLPNNFLFKEKDSKDMAQKIEDIFRLSDEEKNRHRKQFREYVVKNHSLDILVDKLIKEIN